MEMNQKLFDSCTQRFKMELQKWVDLTITISNIQCLLPRVCLFVFHHKAKITSSGTLTLAYGGKLTLYTGIFLTNYLLKLVQVVFMLSWSLLDTSLLDTIFFVPPIFYVYYWPT